MRVKSEASSDSANTSEAALNDLGEDSDGSWNPIAVLHLQIQARNESKGYLKSQAEKPKKVELMQLVSWLT